MYFNRTDTIFSKQTKTYIQYMSASTKLCLPEIHYVLIIILNVERGTGSYISKVADLEHFCELSCRCRQHDKAPNGYRLCCRYRQRNAQSIPNQPPYISVTVALQAL
jgi:hypothetical protein